LLNYRFYGTGIYAEKMTIASTPVWRPKEHRQRGYDSEKESRKFSRVALHQVLIGGGSVWADGAIIGQRAGIPAAGKLRPAFA